ELHVLQGNAGAGGHAQTVASVNEGVGGCSPDTAGATGGQNDFLTCQDVNFARFHFQRSNAQHVAGFVAQEIQGHPLDEELSASGYVALIKRMQHGMTGTVGRGTGALDRLFTKVGSVTAEGTLIDGAVRVTVERHTEVLELVHCV